MDLLGLFLIWLTLMLILLMMHGGPNKAGINKLWYHITVTIFPYLCLYSTFCFLQALLIVSWDISAWHAGIYASYDRFSTNHPSMLASLGYIGGMLMITTMGPVSLWLTIKAYRPWVPPWKKCPVCNI